MLLQEGLPVYFWSRTLSDSEKNWHITELECLAIIESLKKFDRYIYGQEITIFTDHGALAWLLVGRLSLKGKLYRWSMFLSSYRLTIIYIKGKINVVNGYLELDIP